VTSNAGNGRDYVYREMDLDKYLDGRADAPVGRRLTLQKTGRI
jgi:hypothetical protein